MGVIVANSKGTEKCDSCQELATTTINFGKGYIDFADGTVEPGEGAKTIFLCDSCCSTLGFLVGDDEDDEFDE